MKTIKRRKIMTILKKRVGKQGERRKSKQFFQNGRDR